MTHLLTDLLLAHRASGVLLDSLPDALVPKDADTAYLVQTETVQGPGPAGAWKVQLIPRLANLSRRRSFPPRFIGMALRSSLPTMP